jgi:hypothetical protein
MPKRIRDLPRIRKWPETEVKAASVAPDNIAFALALGVNRYREKQATGIALNNALPQSWRDKGINSDCAS